MSEKLDVTEWVAVNKTTSETLPIDVLFELDASVMWEKCVVNELARMIGVAIDSSAGDVLSYLLRIKDKSNKILATQRTMAEESGASIPTVNKVIKRLEESKYLRQVQSGYYVLDPKVIHFGNKGNFHAILKVWRGGE